MKPTRARLDKTPRRYIGRLGVSGVALESHPMSYWISDLKQRARDKGYTHLDIMLGSYCKAHDVQWLTLYGVHPDPTNKEIVQVEVSE